MVKYDPAGKVLWARSAGGTGSDAGYSIAVDGAGNSYVTGHFQGTATFGPFTLTSKGGETVFVAKYDAAGNVVWARSADGANFSTGFGIAVDATGNSYVTGAFEGTATFGPFTLTSPENGGTLFVGDVFVVKYDSAGNVVWARSAGGTGSDAGYSIAVDGAGNSYVTGHFQGTATFGPFTLTSTGGDTLFVAKYDPAGNVLWAVSTGGTGWSLGVGIAANVTGDSYVTGGFSGTATFGTFTLTNAGGFDVFVVKYDPMGNVRWARSSSGGGGGDPSFLNAGTGIGVDGSGNIYVTGVFEGTATFGTFALTTIGDWDIFVAKLSGVASCQSDAECNDGNPCTQNICGVGSVCSNPPVECPPDQACNQQTGQCESVTPPLCGNGILDPAEQCDPPDGVTCDQNCQNLAQAGDSCTTPTPVVDGQREFSNVGATSDGPDEPQMCTFFDRSDILSDVWFCYTASCTGEAVVSLCGSRYDTKMAVYSGCECPTEIPIACSDDDCGVAGFDSRVTFQATAGESYLIRIGGFAGDQGDGILSIRCGTDVCSPDSGECFVANNTPGCSTRNCCQTTCDADPFCCDVAWDDFCAGEAVGLCTGSFPACRADAGDCFQANGTPGCDNVDCCNQVCQIDPFCCVDNWDDLCAEQAGVCALTCGTGESCSTVQTTPGCSDAACCQTVCNEDPFCCSGQWDQECVDRAGQLCP